MIKTLVSGLMFGLKTALALGFVWSLATLFAFMTWAWAVITVPRYVVMLNRLSEDVAAHLVSSIESVAPIYAAVISSLPVGNGLTYIVFFIPSYVFLKLVWIALFDSERFK